MPDFSIKLVSSQQDLVSLIARLDSAPAIAVDIETVNWWDRQIERVSLVQLAFREGHRLRCVILDALDGLDLEPLRPHLELRAVMKVMHNAAYDAVRMARHFRIHTSPVHDTMLAARRGGEKRYSLQAQVQAHLGVQLDKGEQRGDWSLRPLTTKQLRYAALDAVCTLLLYEDQIARGLAASYQLREVSHVQQTSLPLSDASDPRRDTGEVPKVADLKAPVAGQLRAPAFALLGVVTELSGRYSPERLAVSAGSERVGLAGWIIDRALGAEADLDENAAKLAIAELCEGGLVKLNGARRLEATDAGARLWQRLKPT